MDEGKISKYRSEVIEKSINVETLINAIISQHYLKRVDNDFYFEVLYDEYFTSALRRRILEKIVDIEGQMKNDLGRLFNIRNYFAHCNQQIYEEGAGISEGKIIDSKKITRSLNFEELYKEFNNMISGIETYLLSVLEKKGATIKDKL